MANLLDEADSPEFLQAPSAAQRDDFDGDRDAARPGRFPDLAEAPAAQQIAQAKARNGLVAFGIGADHGDAPLPWGKRPNCWGRLTIPVIPEYEPGRSVFALSES